MNPESFTMLSGISKLGKPMQYFYCLLSVAVTAAVCKWLIGDNDYRIVAFILLLIVSVAAILFDILPVLLTAVVGALVWDYFFIPPHFTFRISNTEDGILFIMYFIIALVNAVLTYRIRKAEKESLAKEEKANTVKLYNTLLNSLSHELRTPISAIIGASDNLKEYNSRLTESDKYELLNEISTASLRLNRQVENLLNMSRLESGFLQPKKDWCDITELIYDTVKQVEENTGYTNTNIQADPNVPLFKLDAVMIEQALYNILYNAVIYGGSSPVTVISACHADLLEIIIEDEGPGFPEDEIGNIFDKFYRLKNTRAGGTGLGLSIVKGFIEAHNGTIAAENRKSGGARFTIEIPAETSWLNHLKNE